MGDRAATAMANDGMSSVEMMKAVSIDATMYFGLVNLYCLSWT